MKKLLTILLSLVIVFSCIFSVSAEIATTSSNNLEMLNVPQIRVVTENSNGTKLEKSDGYVNAEIQINGVDGSVIEDSVQFKVRGNTTAMVGVTKKAFTFKFDKKKNVLNMGEGKKWALLANTFDPTLLRNLTVNTIAHELDLPYTSNQQVVELWVDNSYRGCYTLYEPVEKGKDRVDIDIDSNDGKNDFLIEYEYDRFEEDVTYFTVEDLRFISSEPEEPTDEQLNYITQTMSDIVNTLKTGTREEIEQTIDVGSFLKYYLLNEYVKDLDFDMSSVFFYYKDSKLYAGPAWDYDLTAGNIGHMYTTSRQGKAAASTGEHATDKNIYKYICDKEWFMNEAKELYKENFALFSSLHTDGGMIDSLYQEYSEVFARNYSPTCWLVSWHWTNLQKKPLSTYEENLDFMKNWYKERHEWINEYFDIYSSILGDTDCDEYISIFDATTIQRQLASLPVDNFSKVAGDVDADGSISVIDATLIQKHLAKHTISQPIGEPMFQ